MDILDTVVTVGWFLPVTPGTKYVTVAGAIANDVHGKNHHVAGTFGRYVLSLHLLRSDGVVRRCRPAEEHPEFFAATVGGLGLTGLILEVELQLTTVASPLIDSEVIRFDSLHDFFTLSAESDQEFEYTVSRIDCLSSGRSIGRGRFFRGNSASKNEGCS